jgi:alkanesulfonate monooxygenase SsuD/methylene tetrahydromethanopterin reductase-like flavin-dependent oxidoreductase (luciferase family)
MSVLVMPYRHPLHWAKIVTTTDHLSRGRLILGVGVGWMVEEFDALGANFKERGAVADEQLEILRRLWGEDKPSFAGRHYRFREGAFPRSRCRSPASPSGSAARGRTRSGAPRATATLGFPTS